MWERGGKRGDTPDYVTAGSRVALRLGHGQELDGGQF